MTDLEYTPNPERILTTYDTRPYPAIVEERLTLLEAAITDLTARLRAVEEEISYVEHELPLQSPPSSPSHNNALSDER